MKTILFEKFLNENRVYEQIQINTDESIADAAYIVWGYIHSGSLNGSLPDDTVTRILETFLQCVENTSSFPTIRPLIMAIEVIIKLHKAYMEIALENEIISILIGVLQHTIPKSKSTIQENDIDDVTAIVKLLHLFVKTDPHSCLAFRLHKGIEAIFWLLKCKQYDSLKLKLLILDISSMCIKQSDYAISHIYRQHGLLVCLDFIKTSKVTSNQAKTKYSLFSSSAHILAQMSKYPKIITDIVQNDGLSVITNVITKNKVSDTNLVRLLTVLCNVCCDIIVAQYMLQQQLLPVLYSALKHRIHNESIRKLVIKLLNSIHRNGLSQIIQKKFQLYKFDQTHTTVPVEVFAVVGQTINTAKTKLPNTEHIVSSLSNVTGFDAVNGDLNGLSNSSINPNMVPESINSSNINTNMNNNNINGIDKTDNQHQSWVMNASIPLVFPELESQNKRKNYKPHRFIKKNFCKPNVYLPFVTNPPQCGWIPSLISSSNTTSREVSRKHIKHSSRKYSNNNNDNGRHTRKNKLHKFNKKMLKKTKTNIRNKSNSSNMSLKSFSSIDEHCAYSDNEIESHSKNGHRDRMYQKPSTAINRINTYSEGFLDQPSHTRSRSMSNRKKSANSMGSNAVSDEISAESSLNLSQSPAPKTDNNRNKTLQRMVSPIKLVTKNATNFLTKCSPHGCSLYRPPFDLAVETIFNQVMSDYRAVNDFEPIIVYDRNQLMISDNTDICQTNEWYVLTNTFILMLSNVHMFLCC